MTLIQESCWAYCSVCIHIQQPLPPCPPFPTWQLSLSLSLLLLWNLRSPLLLLHVRAIPLNMGPHCWSPCIPCETPSMAPFDTIGIQKLVKATGEMVMLALGWSSPPSISPVKSHWLATESSKPPVKRRDAVGIVKTAEGEKWATGAPGFADLRYLKRSEIWKGAPGFGNLRYFEESYFEQDLKSEPGFTSLRCF